MDCEKCSERKSKTTISGRAWSSLPPAWKKLKNHLQQMTLCDGCPSASAKVCQPRSSCEPGEEVNGGACGLPMDLWDWTADPTVHPLTAAEAKKLKPAGQEEDVGVGFELIS